MYKENIDRLLDNIQSDLWWFHSEYLWEIKDIIYWSKYVLSKEKLAKVVDIMDNIFEDREVWTFAFEELSELKTYLTENTKVKRFEVLTTMMRSIIVFVKNHDEAIRVASSQFEDGETTMMVSSFASI